MTVVQHNSTAAVTSAADAPSRLCHYAVAMEIRGDFACRCCDYADARMSFFPPGEAMPVAADARVLSFHKSLSLQLPLRGVFSDYAFFGYRYPRESLHISLREKSVVDRLFDAVAGILSDNTGDSKDSLLAEKINLLLANCRRFYQRQFILHEDYCAMYVAETEKMVDRFYAEGHGCDVPPIGLPARALGVSETYLASVVRFSTGRTFREFAQLRQLRVAKMLLVDTDRPVADIARSLGFPSAECFE